ncbi:hypothetical protein NYQ83_13830 [Afifella sp. JA880]|uniref:hypothetical protein n=1 Tax=Afifella sp. JA880 TaxID=2975280 RepID=UPI0021BB4983|nr:hypothetical protein [Afifella sp. JA880]MCT8268356.1 hypothetical protein [Afifella sp. JA880]
MAEYSVSTERGGAYKITRETLEEILEEATTFLGSPPDITAQLRGGHSLTVKDLDDFCKDLLVRTNEINSISISGYGSLKDIQGKKVYRRLSFSIRNNQIQSPISLSADGPSEEAWLPHRERIERILSHSKTWYSFISLRDGSYNFLSYVIFGIIIVGLIGYYYDNYYSIRITEGVYSLLIILVIAILWIIRLYLMPSIVFEVGQSARINRRRESLSKFVFGTIILTFLIGVLSSLFAGNIGR